MRGRPPIDSSMRCVQTSLTMPLSMLEVIKAKALMARQNISEYVREQLVIADPSLSETTTQEEEME